MKRALAWIAGLAGVAALSRALSRRRASTAPPREPEPAAEQDDPAEELRRRLAARRGDAVAAGGESVDTEETLDQRRARIHAKAQEAIDAMREPEAGA